MRRLVFPHLKILVGFMGGASIYCRSHRRRVKHSKLIPSIFDTNMANIRPPRLALLDVDVLVL